VGDGVERGDGGGFHRAGFAEAGDDVLEHLGNKPAAILG
jgi:hypothetical protein